MLRLSLVVLGLLVTLGAPACDGRAPAGADDALPAQGSGAAGGAGGVVGAGGAGGSGGEEPEPVAPVGRWQSYFNEPSADNGYVDNTLRDRLTAYIDGAVSGSEIRAHITRLSGAASIGVVVDALAAAHDRGVTIWMVHNGESFVFPELQSRLGERYVHCEMPAAENNSACLSNLDNGTHHMKNWYFSHVELGTNVYEHLVVASSYNITVGQSRNFNDMLAVSGNEELYEAHVAVFEDYLQQHKTDDRYNEPGGKIFVPTAATYSAGFSPQKSGDMVADALKLISEYEEGCSLRVATLNLTRSAIINELIRIREMGCEVRVVTGTPLMTAKKAQLEDAGIATRNVDFEHEGNHIGLHNKMMVYKGFYDTPVAAHPKSGRMWVWTGSQNFTLTPLRFRDDVFVGISRKGVYKNYSGHFEAIWDAGT